MFRLAFAIFAGNVLGIPVYGNFSLGYYYLNIRIGSERQLQSLILDTGSSLTITVCSGCRECARHSNRPYNYTASSSATKPSEDLPFFISYEEGSFYRGHFVADFVFLEGETRPLWKVIGCADEELGKLRFQPADGVMGIGAAAHLQAGTPPNLIEESVSQGLTQRNRFFLCLGHNGGRLSLRDWNSKVHLSGTKQVIQSSKQLFETQYGVLVAGVFVGGQRVEYDVSRLTLGALPPCFDTGSTVVQFPEALLNATMDRLSSFCAGSLERCARQSRFSFCFDRPTWMPEREFLHSFPSLEFDFSSARLAWKPENYFFQLVSNRYCVLWDIGSDLVFGAPVMKNLDFMFDREKFQIGFVEAKCAEESIDRFVDDFPDSKWTREKVRNWIKGTSKKWWVYRPNVPAEEEKR